MADHMLGMSQVPFSPSLVRPQVVMWEMRSGELLPIWIDKTNLKGPMVWCVFTWPGPWWQLQVPWILDAQSFSLPLETLLLSESSFCFGFKAEMSFGRVQEHLEINQAFFLNLEGATLIFGSGLSLPLSPFWWQMMFMSAVFLRRSCGLPVADLYTNVTTTGLARVKQSYEHSVT